LTALDGFGGRYPHELSGGQQQRVALARALAPRPELLLLDEPLSALDAKLRIQLRSEIRRIVTELGVTALYVTHDQEEALAIADQVAVMHRGRLLQIGAPMEVYLRPGHPFVADFVGTTNLLDCQLVDSTSVDIAGRRIPARLAAADGRVAGGARARLALRPEHVELLDDPSAPGVLSGTLAEITFLGPTVRLTLRIAGTASLLVDLPATAWLQRRAEPGAAVFWRPQAGLGTAFLTEPDP
jgi:ABC-type Fe3+/spermidine/putrescine transport system ATPase subunit